MTPVTTPVVNPFAFADPNNLWTREALEALGCLTGNPEHPQMRVDGFVSHVGWRRHLDEVAGMHCIVRNPRAMRFPGPLPGTKVQAGEARPWGVRGWRLNMPPAKGKNPCDYEQFVRVADQFVYEANTHDDAIAIIRRHRRDGRNLIPIGRGRGPFDEHVETGRQTKDFATRRIAAWAGLHRASVYRTYLKVVEMADTKGDSERDVLGAELKRFAALGYNPQYVLQMAFIRLDALVKESRIMFALHDTFREERDWLEVNGVKVGIMVTDNEFATNYLKWRRADIAIKLSTGEDGFRNMVIQCRKGVESMRWFVELVEEIVRLECAHDEIEPEFTEEYVRQAREKAATNEGIEVPGCEGYWYMFQQMLLNGSHTAVKPPTRILMEQLREALTRALTRCPERLNIGNYLTNVQHGIKQMLKLMEDQGQGAAASFEGNIDHLLKWNAITRDQLVAAKRAQQPDQAPEPVPELLPDAEEIPDSVEDSEEADEVDFDEEIEDQEEEE